MRTTIHGEAFPVLRIDMADGEKVVGETGNLSWKTPNVSMRTTTSAAGSSGFLGGLVRSVMSGSSLFMTEYSSAGEGMVAFAARIPGRLMEHGVDGRTSLSIHRQGFLAATSGVTLGVGFQKSLGAGVFGGEGFMMQSVSGIGTVWVELGGDVVLHELARGEVLEVHPGHVGMFEGSVAMDVVVLPGLKNKLFGGDGLFLARMKGPGKVWTQSMTLPGLAHVLAPYMPPASR